MTNILSSTLSMYETVTNIIAQSTKNVVILIDSLSMYLLGTDFRNVYKEVLEITSLEKGKLINYYINLQCLTQTLYNFPYGQI
jgi:archaellum biogenesis ATPase FlaH